MDEAPSHRGRPPVSARGGFFILAIEARMLAVLTR